MSKEIYRSPTKSILLRIIKQRGKVKNVSYKKYSKELNKMKEKIKKV